MTKMNILYSMQECSIEQRAHPLHRTNTTYNFKDIKAANAADFYFPVQTQETEDDRRVECVKGQRHRQS